MYGNKVTRVKDYPIGVMTWGLASIEARSIQSLIMEFEYGYEPVATNGAYTVRKIADDLLGFIKTRYDAAYPSPTSEQALGLYVGGFSANEFFSSQFTVELPASSDWSEVHADRPDGTHDFGASWWGQTDALTRLIVGFSAPSLDELVNRGVDRAILKTWVDDRISTMPLVFDGMPLQDAVDFADYAVQLTIGAFRFGQGPPLCGGDVDIAVVRPGTFQWARRKQWAIKD